MDEASCLVRPELRRLALGLVSNGPVGVAAARAGEVHRAVLVKDGVRIRLAVDGRTIIDHTDDGVRAARFRQN